MSVARWWAAALAALILLLSATASGERAPVAVVRPKARDAKLAEATVRLEAELWAAGFQVVSVDAAPDADARAQVEQTGIEPRPFATIAIVATRSGTVADVWVADHDADTTLVRRVDAAAPSALAVRAVELLRASMIAFQRVPAAVPTAPLPAPTNLTRPSPLPASRAIDAAALRITPPSSRLSTPPAGLFQAPSIALGAAVLQGLSEFGTALASTIRVTHPLPRGFGARLSLLQSVAAPRLEAPGGAASLLHRSVVIDALRPLGLASARAVPVVSLGVGLWQLEVQGSSLGAAPGRSETAWSFVGDLGAGFALRLADRLALTLDLHALLILPEPVVRIAGVEAGRARLPMLLAQLGVMISP